MNLFFRNVRAIPTVLYMYACAYPRFARLTGFVLFLAVVNAFGGFELDPEVHAQLVEFCKSDPACDYPE